MSFGVRFTALLFTPGTRLDRVEKATASGADGVIVDLEDAVPVSEKDKARAEVVAWFATHGRVGAAPFVSALRVNSPRTPHGLADLDAIHAAKLRPDVVVVPKVECAAEVHRVAAKLPPDTKLICLVESVLGVRYVQEISNAAPQVVALGFGGFDLSAETGGEPTWDALLWPRTKVVHACAAAGKLALDQPFIDLADDKGLDAECDRVRRLGFSGKLAVHPKQCATIQRAFQPTAEQLEKARRIVAAFDAAGGHVANIDGQMIDTPMYRSAQRVLQRAGE
jgi:citrate lyase beta subunit